MSSRVLSADNLSEHRIRQFPYRRNKLSDSSALAAEPASSVDSTTLEAAFKKGYEQGQQEGLVRAEQAVEAARLQLTETIHNVEKLQPQLYRQAEEELVRLACEIGAKIVHREITLDKSILSTLVRVSMEKLSRAKTARIHLHPDDYRFLTAAQADGVDPAFGPGVVLVEDNDVEPGGCMVETELGTADARIDSQLHEITDTLLTF